MIPFVRPFLPLFDTLLSVTVILPILLALISFTQSLRSQVQSPGIQGQIKKRPEEVVPWSQIGLKW